MSLRSSDKSQMCALDMHHVRATLLEQAVSIFRLDQPAAKEGGVDREIDHTGGYYERFMSSAFEFG
jgi:hypothetical protein